MIAKILVVVFLIIPLIIACLAFLVGATYLQVKDDQEKTRCCNVNVNRSN